MTTLRKTKDLPYVTGSLYPLDAAGLLGELQGHDTFVLLETARVTDEECSSYLFRDPVAVLEAERKEDVPRLFRSIEKACSEGRYCAGWLSYELGYCLEPKLNKLLEKPRITAAPLAWFGVFKKPETWTHSVPQTSSHPSPVHAGPAGAMDFSCSMKEYNRAIARIHDYIREGETYQVNYTFAGKFSTTTSPEELYLAMRAQQAVSYSAVIRCGPRWILSLSPELFFRRRNPLIWSKPMKGTCRRGTTTAEDAEHASFLRHDRKSRAENIMIVDLIRNDIGRISQPGSVTVHKLCEVERYQTLFQMVSRIDGVLTDSLTWEDVFRSLYPCGSVTGAPKIRTMELINELETAPRGVYTGSVGFITPEGDSVFNVAIRTAVIENRQAVMGIGSGITIDSDPEKEYEECLLKAAFLTRRSEPFSLIETMLWDPQRTSGGTNRSEGFTLLERHLDRLGDSAFYFAFPFDGDEVMKLLQSCAATLPAAGPKQKVRLLLDAKGSLQCTASPLPADTGDAGGRIALFPRPVDSSDPFLYHKTTNRPLYNTAYREALSRGLLDYVFCNEKGEITEGCISTIFARLGGSLATPPATCGLLPGTLREELLENGTAHEQALTWHDLRRADALFAGNSVKGLIQVEPTS